MNAEVYTSANCLYCVKAKSLLNKKGIPYTELSAADNIKTLTDRVVAAGCSPPQQVPQIFIDDVYIGGHDDLVAFLESN